MSKGIVVMININVLARQLVPVISWCTELPADRLMSDCGAGGKRSSHRVGSTTRMLRQHSHFTTHSDFVKWWFLSIKTSHSHHIIVGRYRCARYSFKLAPKHLKFYVLDASVGDNEEINVIRFYYLSLPTGKKVVNN